MESIENSQEWADELRRRAESLMVVGRDDITTMSEEQICELLHELQTHQIELKLQNDELVRSQLELRGSVDKFSDLYDFAPIGYITTDALGRIQECNLAASLLFGIGRSGLRGKSLFGFLDGKGSDTLAAHFGQTLRCTVACSCELEIDTLPERLHVRFKSVVARGHGQERGLIRTAITDTSETTAALDAVRESERRFRELADAMPQLVWTFDRRSSPSYCNRRWYDFSGAGENERLTEVFGRIVHAEDYPRISEAWNAALEEAGQFETEARLKSAHDGTYRWFLIRAIPLHYSGSDVRWFGTATDIEETKQVEQLLKGQSVRKDEFLAMLAHELRNPLHAVASALKIISLNPGPDARQRAETIAERQISRLSRMLDDLLDVSRLSHGAIAIERQPIRLDGCVESALESMRREISDAGLSLEAEIAPGITVDGDTVRLEQVAVNLLSNAAKFTPRGGTIRVRLAREGGHAVLRVTDDGIGIPPAALRSIFDMFKQLSAAPGKLTKGLGVGLALVKELCELHGGSVSAESAGQGKGSEFTVRLPMVAEREEGAPVSPVKAPLRAAAQLAILIVEDEPDSAACMKDILDARGHGVTSFEDGPSALARFADLRPDVALLDLGLPSMDGFELARRLRRLDSKLRIIAVSGYGQRKDVAEAMAAGFESHLLKPVNFARLIELVESAPNDVIS